MAKRKAAAPARTPARPRKKAPSRAASRSAGSRAGTSRPAPTTGKKTKQAKKKRAAPKTTRAAAAKNKTAKKTASLRKKKAPARRSVRASKPRQSATPRRPVKTASRAKRSAAARPAAKGARLDRVRRTLDETASAEEMLPTPPSSLDLDRHASAARSGRLEIDEARRNLGALGALTGGDVDADAENAYFSGDEAPGGDNPTPDQDVVDEIGQAIGVQYQDNEELRASDKVIERDRHRWELDPASSEDYKDRK
jgi:hypothetical protein